MRWRAAASSMSVRMQAEQLDRAYVERWVTELGLDEQWAHVLGQRS